MYQSRREAVPVFAPPDDPITEDIQLGMITAAERKDPPQPSQSPTRSEMPTHSQNQLDAGTLSSSNSPVEGQETPNSADGGTIARSGPTSESSSSAAPATSSSQTAQGVEALAQAKASVPDSSRETKESPKRPKRIIKKPSTVFVTQPPPKPPAVPIASIVPNLSEKELKAMTARHTARNEVYHCAIDRQVVRKQGARPPSPTSKIRTTADREEAERKAGREVRAKRRSRGSEGDNEEDNGTSTTVIERVARFRGDDVDFLTPARPLKRAKWADAEKALRWDKGLLVIRDFGDQSDTPAKLSNAGGGGGNRTWPKGVFKNPAKVRSIRIM